VAPLAVNTVLLPLQMVVAPATVIEGDVMTFTITCAVSVHVPEEPVTTYVVLVIGEATGFAMLVALNPVAGDHA